MKKRLAVTLLVAFAAASAYAGQPRRGHSGGGHSGGGHGSGGGGHAVPRGHAPARGYSGAASRQPRPGGGYSYGHRGYGHGSNGHGYYGRGYGYGYGRGYGYGHYPYYSHYRRYPYYGGYYPYYGYGYPAWGYGVGLGIGFYYGSGYGSGYAYAADRAPDYAEYPSASYSRQAAPPEEYVEQAQPRNGNAVEAGELRLAVVPDDAVVYVDDEFRGTASELLSVRLMPGRHRVQLVRPGYAVAEREVHLGRGAVASLRVELERR